MQDRRGDWWLATAAGLFRYAGPLPFAELATRSPAARLDRARGLSGDWSYRLHESSDGGLWVATERGPDGASAVVQVAESTGAEVRAIVTLADVVEYLRATNDPRLDEVLAYQSEYGVR